MQSNIVLIALFLAVCIRNSEGLYYFNCMSDQEVADALRVRPNVFVPILILKDYNPLLGNNYLQKFMEDHYDKNLIIVHYGNNECPHTNDILGTYEKGRRQYPGLFMVNAGHLVGNPPIRVAQWARNLLNTFKRQVESYNSTEPTPELYQIILSRLDQDRINQWNNQAQVLKGNQPPPPVENSEPKLQFLRKRPGKARRGKYQGLSSGQPVHQTNIQIRQDMINQGNNQVQRENPTEYPVGHPTRYPVEIIPRPDSQHAMINPRDQYQGQSSGQLTLPNHPIRPSVRHATTPLMLDLLNRMKNRENPENYSGGSTLTSSQTHGWDHLGKKNASEKRKLDEGPSRSRQSS